MCRFVMSGVADINPLLLQRIIPTRRLFDCVHEQMALRCANVTRVMRFPRFF